MRIRVAGVVVSGTLGFLSLTVVPASAQTNVPLPFQEAFEDTSVASRGWYDSSGVQLSTLEKFAGTRSFECRFTAGGTNCAGGSPGRLHFADSDSVYIAYYVKYTTNWVGSGRAYHPHMFYFLTNLDPAFAGPAYNFLTAYVEENAGRPLLAIQDGRNIDEQRIGQNLVGVTEQRSVAGCNGDSDGYGADPDPNVDCYVSGSVHWNSKRWVAPGIYFDSTPSSSRYKGNWHLVEAYFKLNTIVNGVGARDGILRYWYDGTPIIDRADVVLRTGARPTMKFNQFLVAPYIGDGSPANQSFWIDNLIVAAARPATPPPPPGGSVPPPGAPTNLRIVP